MFGRCKSQFITRSIAQQTESFWPLLEMVIEVCNRKSIDSWKEMKNRLTKEYCSMHYKNRLINKLERRFNLNIRTQMSKYDGYGHSVSMCLSIKCSKWANFGIITPIASRRVNTWLSCMLLMLIIRELLRALMFLRIALVLLIKTLFESSVPIFVAYSQFLCGTSVIINELVE